MPDNFFPEDAWRCCQCNKLIYNTDREGYPIKGAPIPHFYSLLLPKLCSACFGMLGPIKDKDYWRHQQRDWEQEQDDRRKRFKKMKPGEDYFGQ